MFPSDTNKQNDLNIFIKTVLNKKVNHRVCSLSKLRNLAFLSDFVWDDLTDFKLKPPFIPTVEELGKDFENFNNQFEVIIKVF